MQASDDSTTPSRTGFMRLIRPWEYRHAQAVANVRFTAGGFQLGVGLVLLSLGRKAGTDRERRKCYWWSALEAGDPATVRDQHAAVLPSLERVVGREHPDVLAARANLASATGQAGDPAAGRDQCRPGARLVRAGLLVVCRPIAVLRYRRA
jgi:hypothetical protein